MKELYRITQSWGDVAFLEIDSFDDNSFKGEVISAVAYRYPEVDMELMKIIANYYIEHDLCESQLKMKIEKLEIKEKVTEMTPTVIETALKEMQKICANHRCGTCPCAEFCPTTESGMDSVPANWELRLP